MLAWTPKCPSTHEKKGDIMLNFITATTLVVAMSLIGCGEKKDDRLTI
jgi:hypothetical protein